MSRHRMGGTESLPVPNRSAYRTRQTMTTICLTASIRRGFPESYPAHDRRLGLRRRHGDVQGPHGKYIEQVI